MYLVITGADSTKIPPTLHLTVFFAYFFNIIVKCIAVWIILLDINQIIRYQIYTCKLYKKEYISPVIRRNWIFLPSIMKSIW